MRASPNNPFTQRPPAAPCSGSGPGTPHDKQVPDRRTGTRLPGALDCISGTASMAPPAGRIPISVLALCIAFGCSNSSNPSTTTASAGGQATNNGGSGTSTGGSGVPGTATTGGSATVSNTGGSTSMVAGTGGAGVGGSSGITPNSACLDCLTSNVTNKNCTGFTSADLPPCVNLQGKDPDTGTPNSQLCLNVYNCVTSNMCGLSGLYTPTFPGFVASTCYCGTAEGAACLDSPNGPCRQQIEQGVGSTTPITVIAELTDETTPTGMAIRELNCEAQKCPHECQLQPPATGSGGAPNAGTGGAPNATGGAPSASGGAMGTGGMPNFGDITPGCPTSSSDTVLFNGFATAADASAVSVLSSTTTTAPTVSWESDADAGPDPGSVRVTIPFTKWSQVALLQGILPSEVNLWNRVLFACIRLDSGLFPPGTPLNACVKMKLFAFGSTDNYGSVALSLCPNSGAGWWQLTLPIQPTYADDGTGQQILDYDPAHTTSVQIQIAAPQAGYIPADAGTADGGTLLPTTAVFHIDTIGYR